MFEFLDREGEDEATTGGAQARFEARKRLFETDGLPMPVFRHHALWLLHNCLAHPFLALGDQPSEKACEFHELTSQWLNHTETSPWHKRTLRDLVYDIPKVGNRRAWVLHNTLAHIAIGLAPCKTTFDFHDRTAEKMGVPGWI